MEWISVKNKMPDTATDYLVFLYFKDGGEKLVDIAHFSDGEFYTSMDGFLQNSPTGCHYLACRRNKDEINRS